MTPLNAPYHSDCSTRRLAFRGLNTPCQVPEQTNWQIWQPTHFSESKAIYLKTILALNSEVYE
jgi:hypothetical protein